MIRRKPSLITIASEETIRFLMLSIDGGCQTLASLPLEAFLEGSAEAGQLPKEALQTVNRLLVVPDYWIGNHFHEFPARKPSVINAFIERKLKMDQPMLAEAGDFFSTALVQAEGHRQQLYVFYLQEAVAYRLYRCLETLGISPLRITTPAMVWQAKLGELGEDFSRIGSGFIHLGEGDCFLYFFFMGKFLFSRNIQLPDTGGDASQTYNLLNYEINQSFYLYSQKTKSSVDALFMVSSDPVAADKLSELLGREVQGLPDLPPERGIPDEGMVFPSCRGFTLVDLTKPGEHFISYKPLQKELAWRPVQWAGIAVGLLLAALLTFEAGYLYLRSRAVGRQAIELTSRAAEPPDLVFQNISLALDEITQELARPSGSGTMMRTLLAMPEGVKLGEISLDLSGPPSLKMNAVIDADNPDAFKAMLKVLLDQLNQRFNLKTRPLQEKDVRILLDRRDKDERKPLYQISFSFEIS